MTSFRAVQIVNNNVPNGQKFNSTFKIKIQVYYKVDSILSMPDESHTFLQIYFMCREDTESVLTNRLDTCCGNNNLNSNSARRIIDELDELLNDHNILLRFFKLHMHETLHSSFNHRCHPHIFTVN